MAPENNRGAIEPGAMKRIAFILLLTLSACSSGPDIANDTLRRGETPHREAAVSETTYRIGDYAIHVASWETVNREYQKVCRKNCDKSVKGFVNYSAHEVWSIASIPTVLHEVKHIVEGNFHE